MTTGKTIALTRWTFVGKIMSLLFNMLSRFVISFLPRSKRLLISWLQSPSAVIFEPPKIKSATVSTVSGNYILWWYLPAVSFTNANRCLKKKRKKETSQTCSVIPSFWNRISVKHTKLFQRINLPCLLCVNKVHNWRLFSLFYI